jgi:hypothetical protein
MQQLIDRLAVVLGNHLAEGDEPHASLGAMHKGRSCARAIAC